jgi:hypothetical protein
MMMPAAFWPELILGWSYEHLGRHGEAIATLRNALSHSHGSPLAVASPLAHALGRAGERTPARHLLDDLLARSGERYATSWSPIRTASGWSGSPPITLRIRSYTTPPRCSTSRRARRRRALHVRLPKSAPTTLPSARSSALVGSRSSRCEVAASWWWTSGTHRCGSWPNTMRRRSREMAAAGWTSPVRCTSTPAADRALTMTWRYTASTSIAFRWRSSTIERARCRPTPPPHG